MSKIKVFNGGHFIHTSKETSFEDADVVIFHGGADINPDLYGEAPNKHTNWFSFDRDYREVELFRACVEHKKLMFGICRGMQLMTALNGGKLIQHISHPGGHMVHTKDGHSYHVNSLHHQMCNPYDLPKDEYDVLAYAEDLSYTHLGEHDQELTFPDHAYTKDGFFMEPEAIWFPKTRSLGVQYHPEMMRNDQEAVIICNDLIRKYLQLK